VEEGHVTNTDTPRRRDIMSAASGCDLYARASCPSGWLGWREVRGGCSRRRYRGRKGQERADVGSSHRTAWVPSGPLAAS